MYRRFYFNSFS